MTPITTSHHRTIPMRRRSDWRSVLWACITALAAALALGIAAPHLEGRGEAHAKASALHPTPTATRGVAATRATSSATWDSSVPPASDVFVDPESGAVISPESPTF